MRSKSSSKREFYRYTSLSFLKMRKKKAKKQPKLTPTETSKSRKNNKSL